MFRPVFLFVLALGCAACNNGDKKSPADQGNTEGQRFGDLFKEATAPYQLTDTALLNNTDTASLPTATVSPLIADSIKKKYFGKGLIKYVPLAKVIQKGKERYYIVKASSGQKKGALLLVFDAKDAFLATYPFLLPDADPNTAQLSTIDKNFTVTKSVTQRSGSDVTGEGKEVVAYDATTKAFSLIMMDALDDNPAELKNPIDTFPRTNKLAGDYFLNKKNIVAVRDGRHPAQLLVYIHTENEAADCIGQLKGEFIITSSATAAYRQSGDPCVLELTFKGNTVAINEQSGCGNYRGLDCPLTGTFTRKKPQSTKPAVSKSKRK
jgi:hypothetical protein